MDDKLKNNSIFISATFLILLLFFAVIYTSAWISNYTSFTERRNTLEKTGQLDNLIFSGKIDPRLKTATFFDFSPLTVNYKIVNTIRKNKKLGNIVLVSTLIPGILLFIVFYLRTKAYFEIDSFKPYLLMLFSMIPFFIYIFVTFKQINGRPTGGGDYYAIVLRESYYPRLLYFYIFNVFFNYMIVHPKLLNIKSYKDFISNYGFKDC